MKAIKSKDNTIYKEAFKLTKKKYRDEKGLYLLEGIKPLEDAMQLNISVRQIFIREGMDDKVNFPETAACILDRNLFDKISSTKTSQGILAVVEKKKYSAACISELLAGSGKNIVVLDRLQDPGNVGTIVRTAEAAGYGAVAVVPGTADIYSSKVVRAAAGSLFRMPIFFAESEDDAIKALKHMKKCIVTTSLDTELTYDNVDLTENIALVIGNEGKGVSEGFLNASDIKIKIPMAGSIESLNAAVAAGILMYQSHNKTQNSER